MPFCRSSALSQAVAWVPGRNDSLAAAFILLSFYSWIKYSSDTKKTGYFALHSVCFALALFTKETSAAFIPVVLLYSILVRKDFTAKLFLKPAASWSL